MTASKRLRMGAILGSLFTGILIMGLKFQTWRLTGSTAILSDALESVVNVVAAAFAVMAVRAAHAPPDANHPYGHGKIEFVTAVFEGGLITFAALVIAYEAIRTLLAGPVAPNLDEGLWLILLAGGLNGMLGAALLMIGKRTESMALVADGKHVLSDFLTSMGVILGLGVVKLTNLAWLDPVIALLMAVVLGLTGVPLVKGAVDGLIDAADGTLLERLRASLERHRPRELIRFHHVRAMRNGRRIHVDGHVVIPEFWKLSEAHDRVHAFETEIVASVFQEGEIEFHLDPCRRVYCKSCEVESCPV
ncbi:MAG: cation transporter, partial [Bdellovibrionales bacterium]|nr:cation transporter [Bdellovibrionales bacterium]